MSLYDLDIASREFRRDLLDYLGRKSDAERHIRRLEDGDMSGRRLDIFHFLFGLACCTDHCRQSLLYAVIDERFCSVVMREVDEHIALFLAFLRCQVRTVPACRCDASHNFHIVSSFDALDDVGPHSAIYTIHNYSDHIAFLFLYDSKLSHSVLEPCEILLFHAIERRSEDRITPTHHRECFLYRNRIYLAEE